MLVFSITPYQNQNRSIGKKSRIWEKQEGKYAKLLAKIQIIAIIIKRDMRRNFLSRFIEIDLYGDKTKNPFGAKICMNTSSQVLLYIVKVKFYEDQ